VGQGVWAEDDVVGSTEAELEAVIGKAVEELAVAARLAISYAYICQRIVFSPIIHQFIITQYFS
jgi:hypothetical protein